MLFRSCFDIYSVSKHYQLQEQARYEIGRIQGLDEAQLDILVRNGYPSAQAIADAPVEEIADILEISDEAAAAVIDAADQVVSDLIMEEAERRKQGKPETD